MDMSAPPAVAPPDLATPNLATHRQIALVLEELSQEVEELGASLCGDMDVAMRHMDSLQAIDLIAQKQRSLARLLHADCLETEVERIGLDILRERMRMLR
jgi:hypothetical protein